VGQLDGARYVSLTTYKRDGTGVASPVWITGDAGHLALMTGSDSWKAKRLARNPAVQVEVCDARGRVAPGAYRATGTATVSTDTARLEEIERQLAAKYGIQYRLIGLLDAVRNLQRRFGRGGRSRGGGRVVIELSLPGSD
jgi:PPOX class probable F420-dependent enzyme